MFANVEATVEPAGRSITSQNSPSTIRSFVDFW